MDQAVEQPTRVHTQPPDFQVAWQMVASQLRMEMKRADYETWVQALKPLSYKEGVYRLGAANSYARDWVESRLRTRIGRLLEGVFNQAVTVHFSLLKGGGEARGLPLAVMEPGAAAPERAEARAQAEADTTAIEDAAPVDTAAAGAPTAVPAAEETAPEVSPAEVSPVADAGPRGGRAGRQKVTQPDAPRPDSGSPRKIQLQRAYGTERARVIQPERGMFLTKYFFTNWLPLLGHSAMTTVLAARSLCYWNPLNGELRNTVETDMSELARLASVSVRTVKDVLNNELVKRYFLRYKVRRIMTANGVRTAGIRLQVRMDDPLTPEDQEQYHLPEEERWYSADFEDESED